MKARFRELFPQAPLGVYEPGRFNAITDVDGIEVGQVTLRDESKGFCTGVTAIWPRRDCYDYRPRAAVHALHGAGEMTGALQVGEWGLLETPILLTSTLNVGAVHDAVVEYLAEKHPQMGLTEDVVIPVVAECDDSFLSRARGRPVRSAEVRRALDEARSGAVAEGSVGAGTGMQCFSFKAGIGTSSRVVPIGEGGVRRAFRLGVLLNANFGVRRQLRVLGHWIGPRWADRLQPGPHPERSVIVVVATDAPMRPDQLRRLAVRAGMALGRSGSYASHSSGEIVLAVSTGLGENRGNSNPVVSTPGVQDGFLNPFYEAVTECVEEGVLNALAAGETTSGRDGHRAHALPLEELKRLFG